MKEQDLKSRIGQKAEIKILKVRRSSYWYRNIIGKKIFATLVKESVFTDKKTFQWKVVDNTSVSGYAWINIKDAEIISWLGKGHRKASDKFNPIKIGFKRDEGAHKIVVFSLYRSTKKGKVWVGWISKNMSTKNACWNAYKVVHHKDGGKPSENWCFHGNIPTNSFAKQLFKNIFG